MQEAAAKIQAAFRGFKKSQPEGGGGDGGPRSQRQPLSEENMRLRQQIEQERRDRELALRRAQESNSSIEDLNTPQPLDVLRLRARAAVEGI